MNKNIISVSLDFEKLATGEVDATVEVTRPDNVKGDERYNQINKLINEASQLLCNVLYDSMELYIADKKEG
jgi:hypothetical protein